MCVCVPKNIKPKLFNLFKSIEFIKRKIIFQSCFRVCVYGFVVIASVCRCGGGVGTGSHGHTSGRVGVMNCDCCCVSAESSPSSSTPTTSGRVQRGKQTHTQAQARRLEPTTRLMKCARSTKQNKTKRKKTKQHNTKQQPRSNKLSHRNCGNKFANVSREQ